LTPSITWRHAAAIKTANAIDREPETGHTVLHTLRKLKATLGHALAGMLLLTWLGAALQPCLMTGSPATHHMTASPASHDCCPPGHTHPAQNTTNTHCTALGCDMQAVDQQSPDPVQLTRMGGLVFFALLLIFTWPRLVQTARVRLTLRAPPPRPHPTLAYCTLLI